MKNIRNTAVVLSLAVLALVVPALAQDDRSVSDTPPTAQPSALPGIFGEVLDVRVINLEVVVTDKQGTPILGLGPEDMRLEVDGEEVPIDYFSEVRGGRALGEAEGLPGVPAAAPGEFVGTSYLVFIDDFFGIKPDRNTVLRSIKDELAFLKPEDRMAIVSYDGKDLEMLSTWSNSQRHLERVLNNALIRPAKGLHRQAERKRFDFDEAGVLEDLIGATLDEPEASAFNTQLSPQERAYVQLVTEQVNRSVAAASATLRSFAKPPGRKVMLLLSGGWPFVPADYLTSDVSRLLFHREGPYGVNLYDRLVETANLLGYTLYPVDLPGLQGNVVDAETSTPPANSDLSFNRSFLREREVQATLRYLARETGGRALLNSKRISALGTVANDIDSYYWIGFTPQRERDDQSHEVVVRLSNPEFRARSRGSFLDSSRTTEVSMAVESTLLFGNAAAEGTLDVEVGAPVRAGRRKMEVPLKVVVPLDKVTVLPVAGQYGTQLELRVAVQDENGQQAPIPVIPLNMAFNTKPPANAVGTYETKLLLRRKFHDAVVAIHDPASGRILSAGFDIVPADD